MCRFWLSKINHWKRFVVLNHFIFALTCCFLITHVIWASICLLLIHNWLLMKPSRSISNVAYLFHDSTTSSLTKPSRPMQPLKTHHTQSKVQTLYVQNPHNINPKPWWPKTSKTQILNSQFSKQEIDPPSMTMPIEICRFFAWVHHICALLLLCFPIFCLQTFEEKDGE